MAWVACFLAVYIAAAMGLGAELLAISGDEETQELLHRDWNFWSTSDAGESRGEGVEELAREPEEAVALGA